MSLHHKDQFVLSNLFVSEKTVVIVNILVYKALLSTIKGVKEDLTVTSKRERGGDSPQSHTKGFMGRRRK